MRIAILIFVSFFTFVLNAQILLPKVFVETNVKASVGENTPYYLISNKHGVFSAKKNDFLLRSGIIANFDTSKRISLSYGLDAAYRYDSENEIWLQQAFVRTKVYFLILQGGLIEEFFGNQDEELSSGAYLYSGNARPMPKIALYTNDYISIPFTNNLLEIKGYIAHGWFGEKEQYVKNAFLHQKYLYIRIGEKKYPLSINLGIHHTAMWGGTSPEFGSLPADWNAFKSVLLARMKDTLGPINEQKNVLGNHLASYSMGIDYRMNRYKLKFYWQTMLEDKNGRVGVDWKNKGDGLWGIVLMPLNKDNGIKKLVLEFFNSTNQSGNPEFSGGDDYFNNYLYRSGWSYGKMIIGTPLITSPIYSKRTPEMFDYLENNCVRALIAGVTYKLNEKLFNLWLTYSMNYGTVSIPYNNPRDQFYSAIDYSYPSKRYRNLKFSWQGAFDFGSHLGNNAGLMFKMRKSF